MITPPFLLSIPLASALAVSANEGLVAGMDDDMTRWVFRGAVVALCTYVLHNERHQNKQDMALKDLQLNIANELTHKSDFKELQRSVQNVDRLVRLIAAKQGINTRELD